MPAVHIEHRVAGLGGDGVGQPAGHLNGPVVLFCKGIAGEHAGAQIGGPLLAFGLTDQQGVAAACARVQRYLTAEEAGRQDVFCYLSGGGPLHIGCGKEAHRAAQRAVVAKNMTGIHKHRHGLAALGTGGGEVYAQHLLDVAGILHTGTHAEISVAAFLFGLHPRLGGLGHVLGVVQVDAEGQHSGHTVQQVDLHGPPGAVGQRDHAHQRSAPLLRQGEVGDIGLHAHAGIGDLQVVHADLHGLGGGGIAEGLHGLPVHPQQGAEAHTARVLVGLMRREKLHNGVILVFDTEAGDALPTVYIVAPHGHASFAGDAGQKTAEGFHTVKGSKGIASVLIQHGLHLAWSYSVAV